MIAQWMLKNNHKKNIKDSFVNFAQSFKLKL